jgi:ATP-dependent Lon protease
LPPGSVYGSAVDDEDHALIFRIEASKLPGSGKIRFTGSPSRRTSDSANTAFSFLRARAQELGLGTEVERWDYQVQLIRLSSREPDCDLSMPVFVALYSLLQDKPAVPALVVTGAISIQGTLAPVRYLSELLQTAMDAGARRVLMPTEGRRMLVDVPSDVLEHVDPVFYSDALTAAVKALGIA